jgi:predicted nucleic acid-binding protein
VILVDTGPLVALFDRQDANHLRCVKTLRSLREPIGTTTPVLTEAFHRLGPASVGAERLREFVVKGGLAVWYFEPATMLRAFELMEQYADHPMDLADASLVTAAEAYASRRIFTIDRNDIETYRVRRGHRHLSFEVVP